MTTHLTLLQRIFNIGGQEWNRIGIAWFARFFWRVAYMVAWTVLTVLFIESYGIANLPWFYIIFAILVMFGPFIFSTGMRRFTIEKNIIILCSVGAVFFVTAMLLQEARPTLSLFFTIATFSIIISQLNILLSVFQEELFSPRESIRAFPIIESAETVGGIAAGFLLTATVGIIPIHTMTSYVAALLLAIIPVILFFLKEEHKAVRIRRKNDVHAPAETTSWSSALKNQLLEMKKTGFLKGLAVIVLLNAMFLSMVEFQFTSVIEEQVGHGPEKEHSLLYQPWSQIAGRLDNHVSWLKASIVDTASSVDSTLSPKINSVGSTINHSENLELQSIFRPEPDFNKEEALAHGLSRLHIIFSLIGLAMQLLIASRLIGRLGVMRSIIFHAGVVLTTALGMLYKFGFTTVVLARGNVEGSGVIYKNAYHSSFYALNHEMRVSAKQMMEGIFHPLGFALGTAILIALTSTLPLSQVLSINIILIALVSSLLLAIAWAMQKSYTGLSKKHLELSGEHPMKFDAIEVLSQNGHTDGHFILSQNLIYKNESDWIKIKILDGMGNLKHPESLSEITDQLLSGTDRVKIAAAKAIHDFEDVLRRHAGQKVISRYRIISSLYDVFRKTDSLELRKEIIRTLSLLEDENVIKFLLNTLSEGDEAIKPDVIYALRMFRDANSAGYIWQYLDHQNPWIRAHAIITLWDFKKFRLKLLLPMNTLIESKNAEELKAGLFLIGETNLKNELHRLLDLINHGDPEIKFYAALSLSKIGHPLSKQAMIDILTHEDRALALKAHGHLSTLEDKQEALIREHLHSEVNRRINSIARKNKNLHLEDYPREDLDLLLHYYHLIRDYKEVMYIERLMEERKKSINHSIL